MTRVVAALIWDRNNERFMICQRPEHKARGLLWEFVGGKVEAGETKEAALIRECREDLGIELSVGPAYMDVTHEYPDLTVHLTLFHAAIAVGTPQLLEHCELRWITPAEMENSVNLITCHSCFLSFFIIISPAPEVLPAPGRNPRRSLWRSEPLYPRRKGNHRPPPWGNNR